MRKYLKRKATLAICLAAAMILTLGGCGAGSFDKVTEMALNESQAIYDSSSATQAAGDFGMAESYESGMMNNSAAPEQPEAASDSSVNPLTDSSRKLIKTVNMQVETREFDVMVDTLTGKVTGLGGYIERMDTYNGSSYSDYRNKRNASMTIRIPKDKLEEFLGTVSDIGNVVSRSDYVEDVTLTYVDLESHKEVLEAEQERLLAFLEQAETVEDMITLESRLSQVRYQLESMESQLRTFDNQVDYSTVYLDIDEVKELTPVVEEEPGRLERMAEGFMKSLKNIGEGILDLCTWLVIHLPYLLLCVIVILVIIFGIKGTIEHSRKKRAKKLEKMQQGQAKPQEQK